VSPLRGKKPIFGPVSKNNTGMAVLCADLLVKMKIENKNFDSITLGQGESHTVLQV